MAGYRQPVARRGLASESLPAAPVAATARDPAEVLATVSLAAARVGAWSSWHAAEYVGDGERFVNTECVFAGQSTSQSPADGFTDISDTLPDLRLRSHSGRFLRGLQRQADRRSAGAMLTFRVRPSAVARRSGSGSVG
jgi:hypothetical protein